jgi:hypothetical protein
MTHNSQLQFPKTAISDGTDILGTATSPVRVDPTGTTVQPVSVVSGGGTPPANGPTGSPVPADADYIGGKNGSGNLTGISVDNSGNINANVVSQSQSSTSSSPAATSVSNTSGSILASNASRKECVVANTGTTPVYLGLGQAPTTSAYHICLAACATANDGTGGIFTSDIWVGAINAICSVSGTVVVTELT